VLLPTLRRLAGDVPDAQWQVGALRVGDRLRVGIVPTAELERARVALQDFDATPLRERLAAVHGPDTRIALDLAGEAPALRIDAPFQPSAAPAPERNDDEATDP
jgi:hypothetical protein